MDCPIELIHPPEDCTINSSLSFTIQCRRYWHNRPDTRKRRSFSQGKNYYCSSFWNASGLGCKGGVGRGMHLSRGGGGGGGHGGKGGDDFFSGESVQGGIHMAILLYFLNLAVATIMTVFLVQQQGEVLLALFYAEKALKLQYKVLRKMFSSKDSKEPCEIFNRN